MLAAAVPTAVIVAAAVIEAVVTATAAQDEDKDDNPRAATAKTITHNKILLKAFDRIMIFTASGLCYNARFSRASSKFERLSPVPS